MNPLLSTYRDEFQLAVVVILALLAWFRGGGPEKMCAGVLLAMFCLDRVYRAVFGSSVNLESADIWYAVLDAGVLVAFVAIALRANRFYPLLLAGFQLVAVKAHLVRELVESVSPIAYFILYVGPSYFQILIVGVGIGMHIRRSKRFGSYRDWRLDRRTGSPA